MDLILKNKIFYYDDESENLLEEIDAEETTLEEILEEVFNLEDDDISYVGFIVSNNETYKIKSDNYDSYKIYKYDIAENNYMLINLGNWEKCKDFITINFVIF